MAIELNLTTWERIQLLQTLPSQGPLPQLLQSLRVGQALDLSEQERKEVGMTVDQASGAIRWQDRERQFPITLDTADFEYLCAQVKARREWAYSPLTVKLLSQLQDVSGKNLGLG